jgi:glycine/D-amino acid oxidase-like deaminating enzyme
MSEATAPATASLPTSARAVIVGAGIVGASVAYHLAREGWTDVVLIDQGPLWETGGSTSHAPGLVFQLNPSHTMTQLARATVDLLSSLELDGQPCYLPVGGIEVATTEERWAELDRRYGRARGYGLEPELLTPAQVRERIPLIDPDRILGGLHVERDGIAKAVRGAEAMGRAAAAAGGARAFGGCEATGLVVEGGRVRGVETTLGPIRTETVVLCAGIWGPKAGRMLGGVQIPLAPVQHQYAFTAPLAELEGETREAVHPILRHQDHSMYLRQHADADGSGTDRHEPRLTEPEEIRPPGGEVQPSIVPFTPDDFATAAREAGALLPPLRDVALRRTLNGLMSFTPDGFPLLGESGSVRGLWLAEAIWVTHSGGAGRGLRHHPSAPAVRAGPRAAAHAVLRARGGARGRVLRERRVGAAAVVRGQRGARGRRRRLPAGVGVGGAALVADRGRRARGVPRARRAVRRLAVHEA